MSDGEGPRRFLGGLLMAVGGLIALLSGLCTGSSFLKYSVLGNHGELYFSNSLEWLPLIVGSVPMAIGIGLFLLGRQMLRRPPPDAP